MARGTLKISKEISLPIDAITQTIAAIGRKGAGKTYLSQMIAEQMLDAKGQIVVVDPVGNWWGLRVNADGKTKGKEIFVIGGDHGDVPLVPEAGKRIAQLLVEKAISAVLDVSSFGIGERKRFCADFGEEFFQLKKKKRTPVHIFLEESQLIVPQNIRPEEARMYSAYEQIVRLGRNYGIGCTLITQRPQSVNKEVLSQVECLCVLQITGLHERKALEAWVQEVGADRKLIGELPGLERGEGYVWSPAWLRIYQRVHFSKKQTFDASATPEVGKKTKAASLSAVDVDLLKKDIADVVEQAEKDDPVALRKKIVALERELKTNSKPDPAAITRAVGTAVAQREHELLTAFETERAKYRFALTNASNTLKQIEKLTNRPEVLDLAKIDVKSPPIPITRVTAPVIPVRSSPVPIPQLDSNPGEISQPEQKVLNAIAWMNSIGVAEPAKEPVAFIAGYTPTSGSFKNAAGALRSKGLVIYPNTNIALTDEGRAIAVMPDDEGSLHDRVLQRLGAPERKILEILLQTPGQAIGDQELAPAAGYTPTSGSFKNARGQLRTFGLVIYPTPGHTQASDLLFPR